MNEVFDWFSGLATIGGFLYFLLGFATAYLWHCAKAKMRHKEIKIPWHIAGIAIGSAAILIGSIQSQSAYLTARETAEEVQQCQKEFNQALQARIRISNENDEVSLNQRTIVYDWIHHLIFPPPPYDKMDPNDPQRQAYGINITIETDSQFKKQIARQNELDRQRENNPLPDPTCGKS